MKKEYLLAGALCLIFAGLVGIDYSATTINSDGSVFLSALGHDENGSFGSSVMALDATQVSSSQTVDEEMSSDLSVRGSGPILFSDYAVAMIKRADVRDFCTFLSLPQENGGGQRSVYTSGIVKRGEYDSVRSFGSGLFGMTSVNGTGMMLLGSQSQDNRTMKNRGFISGNMSVNDVVRYGVRS